MDPAATQEAHPIALITPPAGGLAAAELSPRMADRPIALQNTVTGGDMVDCGV